MGVRETAKWIPSRAAAGSSPGTSTNLKEDLAAPTGPDLSGWWGRLGTITVGAEWSLLMPTKKKKPEPPWQIILEIRSQNRATIEAVEVNRETLGRRLDELEKSLATRIDVLEKALGRVDRESRSRDASLEVAIRELKVSVQQNSVDLRDLGAKVEALSRLEERVAALERLSRARLPVKWPPTPPDPPRAT